MRRLILAAALALTACGGDSGPARIEAEGQWSGGIQDNGATIGHMTLTLVETSGAVTGSGNLTAGTLGLALTTSGTYAPPSLSLTVSAPGYNDMNLTATVGETSMTGTLNGSGFVNSGITLTRQ
jgi:hypothetical protein